MGALPKRKISKIRRDRRRAHYLRVKMGNMMACPQCHTLKFAHHVCPTCGTYNGVEVVEIKESE
jgi:large subunit ribosomal protein L32